MGDISAGQISSGVGFGLSVAQGIAAHKQASREEELRIALAKENNQAAQSAMLSSFRSLEDEQDQTDENFIANDIDSQIMEAKARGAAEASAGASGVGGSVLEMQLDDITVASDMNHSRRVLNREREMNQIRSKGKEAVNIANARINRMPSQSPKLDILGIGVSGFRNAVALNKLSGSLDNVFGESIAEIDTSKLVDSTTSFSQNRTA